MQPVANSLFNVEADQLKTYIKEMNGRKPWLIYVASPLSTNSSAVSCPES